MNKPKGGNGFTPPEVQAYINKIKKTPLLTPEEEVDLAQRIRQGDEQAHEKLTKANLLYVVRVAKQYQNQGLSLQDLINEGNIGLIKAAKRFDETRGFKFISYAKSRIKGYILNALAEYNRIVENPRGKHIGKIINALAEFLQENGYDPTADELLLLLEKRYPEVTLVDIERFFTHGNRDLSLNVRVGEDGDLELIDMLVGDDPRTNNHTNEQITHQTLKEVVELLFPSQDPSPTHTHYTTIRQNNLKKAELKDVLQRYFGIEPYEVAQTIDEIAEDYKVSRTTISNRLDKIIRIARRKAATNKELYTLLQDHGFL